MNETIPSPVDFLGTNKDWREFATTVSDNTGKKYLPLWIANSGANRSLVKKHGWASEHLQDIHRGKTAVMLGASPAIKNQIDIIRGLRGDPDFVTVGVTSGLKFLIENNIKPDYCMIADADPKLARFWDGLDMNNTKGITLIANICTHPNMLAKWQGDIKFLAIYTAIKELDRKLQKKYRPINGCGNMFPALASQYNVGTAFAHLILGCGVIIFVGNELSFPSADAEKDRYYPDREDVKDKWARKAHPDIYGNIAYTNYMLMSLKFTLEDFLGRISGNGWFLNCTEAGIFGVSKRYGNLPWIHQLKLKNGIAQARSIMRTGEPFYVS